MSDHFLGKACLTFFSSTRRRRILTSAGGGALWLSKLANVLVRLDHVASVIVKRESRI
jgi:hypothetical protein